RRGREPLVQRRQSERTAWPDRIRPPLRAHDVSGIAKRARHTAYRARRTSWRIDERLDLARQDELLRNRSRESPGVGALARVRPDGVPHSRDDAGEAGQPTRGGEERAAV